MNPKAASPEAAGACACGRLRRASRALTQFYDDALAPSGLRVTQYSLLRTLAREGTAKLGTIARGHLLDRTALSRALDPLVERGYVKVAAGRDARTREITLTRSGTAALAAATAHWQRAQFAVARRLGRERLDGFLAILRELETLHPDAAGRPATKAEP